jgi:hypothetical protein
MNNFDLTIKKLGRYASQSSLLATFGYSGQVEYGSWQDLSGLCLL